MNLSVLMTVGLGFIAGIPLILFKKSTHQQFSSWSYTFIWSFLALITVSPLVLLNFDFPLDIRAYGLIALSAIGWALVNLFNFLAFKYADASVVLLIGRLSNVTIFLVGVMILLEPVGIPKLVGLLLITIGSMTVIIEKRKINLDKGIILSLLPVAFMTIAFYFDKQASTHFNPFVYIFIQQAIQILFILPWVRNKKEPFILLVQEKKHLIPAMVCFVTAFSGFIFLLKSNQLSVLPLVYETAIFISSMFLGIVFLGERNKLLPKLIGAIFTIVGVYLLGI